MSNYKGPYNSFSESAEPIYNQSNILGTVSQSNGVPTGAIIERGSNANGEWVKYAGGTLICWRTFVVDEVSNIDTRSGITSHRIADAVDYPATFSSVQSAALSINTFDSDSNSLRRHSWAGGFSQNAGNQPLRNDHWYRPFILSLESDTSSIVGMEVSLIAIGRWY